MHPKIQKYLGFAKYGTDFNLETIDISGAVPLNHYGKLECKIKSARPNDIRPILTTRRFNDDKPVPITDHQKQVTQQIRSNSSNNAQPQTNQQKQHGIQPNNHQETNEERKVQFNGPSHEIKHHEKAEILYTQNPKSVLKQTQNHANSKSQDLIPAYKYVGKCEKKNMIDKADVRLDVHDINQKKSHYDFLVNKTEKEQKRLDQFTQLRNLDIHRPDLGDVKLKEITYKDGHRVEAQKVQLSRQSEARIPSHMRPTVYDYVNPAVKQIAMEKTTRKNEAEFFMQTNPVILRDLGPKDKTYHNHHQYA